MEEENPEKWRHYNYPEEPLVKDEGWGCVYRSF